MMKTNRTFLALAAVGALVVGCGPYDEDTPMVDNDRDIRSPNTVQNEPVVQNEPIVNPPPPPAPGTVGGALGDVRSETRDAADALRDYGYAQRIEFVDGMRQDMAEVRRELDAYATDVERAGENARAEAREKLRDLNQKAQDLERRLGQLGNASEQQWEETKDSFRDAYEDFRESLRESREWLSDKIEP
jgi:hypothetical protein